MAFIGGIGHASWLGCLTYTLAINTTTLTYSFLNLVSCVESTTPNLRHIARATALESSLQPLSS